MVGGTEMAEEVEMTNGTGETERQGGVVCIFAKH